MSNWLNSLSREERDEIFNDNCTAYASAAITDIEFKECLVKLGYNATDISDLEKFYRPTPPENEDADTG